MLSKLLPGQRALVRTRAQGDQRVGIPLPEEQPSVDSRRRRGLLQGTLAGLAALPAAALPPAAAPPPTAAAPQPPKPTPPQAPKGAAAAACGPTKGAAAARDPAINRGCATPAAARQQYSLQGLLPPRQVPLETEVGRARAALALCSSDFERHRLLMALKETNRAAFYALLQGPDMEGLLRIVYTPTIGDACLRFGQLVPRPSCLYVNASMAGNVAEAVANWPQQGVRLAVVTDGERILGLGDLGCHGAGIPIGKCIVYSAAGIPPDWLLPIVVDVGTENDALRDKDPLYLGLQQRRVRGDAYYSLMDELVAALQQRYGPSTIIHWEDLAPAQGFSMLQRLRSAGTPTFNDDIECTAAVTVAALLGALRLRGVVPLAQQRFLFFGAGQANLGTARLLVRLMQQRGIPEFKARASIWMIDRRGLITTARKDLTPEKAQFAQDPKGRLPLDLAKASSGTGTPVGGEAAAASRLLRVIIDAVQPTALIGAAAVGGAFDRGVIESLTKVMDRGWGPYARPICFCLSNPTDKAEASYADVWGWSGGRAVYASGTGFPGLAVAADGSATPLELPNPWGPAAAASNGGGGGGSGGGGGGGGRRLLRPAMSNNSHVFPGLGLGCIATGASFVNDDLLLAAAGAIAGMVTPEELDEECILPSLARLRDTTAAVAAAVAVAALRDDLGTVTVDSARCLPALRAADAARPGAPRDEGVVRAAALDCVKRLQFSAATA